MYVLSNGCVEYARECVHGLPAWLSVGRLSVCACCIHVCVWVGWIFEGLSV